jgi:hypothetical protein
MPLGAHSDHKPILDGVTPHLLGRPVLFEITELNHPEAGIAFRWVVSFYVAEAPHFVFELRKGKEALPSCLLPEGWCYELYENGTPCFERWHLGPETARDSIVSIIESFLRNNLQGQTSRMFNDHEDARERNLPIAFLHSLSAPGLEVLNLFLRR